MNFYVFKDNQQLGPYSAEQIHAFLRQGLVVSTDQMWAEGWPAWMAVGTVPGFATASEPTAPPAIPPPVQSQPPPLVTADVRRVERSKPFIKYIAIGVGVLVALAVIVLGTSYGRRAVGKMQSSSKDDESPEWYIKVIVKDMQDRQHYFNASDVHYSVQKTDDSSMPLTCEIDYTMNASTGADGQGLASSSLPLSFKAFFGFEGHGWKLLQVTDSNDNPLPDNNEMADFFRPLTGSMQPVFNYPPSSSSSAQSQ